MKTLLALAFVQLASSSFAHAENLSPAAANAICHQKAVRAVHFISESSKPFAATYKAEGMAEISTRIIYEFKNEQSNEILFTVIAYAYPDDQSCTLGSVVNNIAGND